jgi:hypothetical protein
MMKKKEKYAILMITILLTSVLGGVVFVTIFHEDEIIATGTIEVVSYPRIYEEKPEKLTIAFIHSETGVTYYLSYENNTLVTIRDRKYWDLQGHTVAIRGKLRYAKDIEDGTKHLILIVLEIDKIR